MLIRFPETAKTFIVSTGEVTYGDQRLMEAEDGRTCTQHMANYFGGEAAIYRTSRDGYPVEGDVTELRKAGYSERFIEIWRAADSQGAQYLMFDADAGPLLDGSILP